MPNKDKSISLIVGIAITAILAAFLLPVAIDELAKDNATTTYNQTEGEVVNPVENLEVNMTDAFVDANATYVVNDTDTASSTTQTINNGSSHEFSLDDGGTLNISVSETGDTYAVADYTYPNDYGWGDGTKSIYDMLAMFFVLAVLLASLKYVRN